MAKVRLTVRMVAAAKPVDPTTSTFAPSPTAIAKSSRWLWVAAAILILTIVAATWIAASGSQSMATTSSPGAASPAVTPTPPPPRLTNDVAMGLLAATPYSFGFQPSWPVIFVVVGDQSATMAKACAFRGLDLYDSTQNTYLALLYTFKFGASGWQVDGFADVAGNSRDDHVSLMRCAESIGTAVPSPSRPTTDDMVAKIVHYGTYFGPVLSVNEIGDVSRVHADEFVACALVTVQDVTYRKPKQYTWAYGFVYTGVAWEIAGMGSGGGPGVAQCKSFYTTAGNYPPQ